MVEIRRSPVEVGSLSHYLQGFIHPRWLAGFLPSTVCLVDCLGEWLTGDSTDSMTWSCDDSVSGTLGRHMLLRFSFQGSYFVLSSIIEAWFIVYLFNMRIPVPVLSWHWQIVTESFSVHCPKLWLPTSPIHGDHAGRDLLRSYFRKHRKDLRLAQPPKRLFAGVQSRAQGGEDNLNPGGVHWDWQYLLRLSTWYKKLIK